MGVELDRDRDSYFGHGKTGSIKNSAGVAEIEVISDGALVASTGDGRNATIVTLDTVMHLFPLTLRLVSVMIRYFDHGELTGVTSNTILTKIVIITLGTFESISNDRAHATVITGHSEVDQLRLFLIRN